MLQVGYIQVAVPSECDQCLSVTWKPTRPHHQMIAGYYNSKIVFWNLPVTHYCSKPGSLMAPWSSSWPIIRQCTGVSAVKLTDISYCLMKERKIKFREIWWPYEQFYCIKCFMNIELAWLHPLMVPPGFSSIMVAVVKSWLHFINTD
jgi:hypothetical protein